MILGSTGELQQEDDLLLLLSRGDSEGEPLEICRDPVKDSLWMITTSSIYQVSYFIFLPLPTDSDVPISRSQPRMKIALCGRCILPRL
jgi:hypothetical protein